MEGKLIGTTFIVMAALLLAPPIMLGCYRFIRSAEKARMVSAIAILVASPLVTFTTIFWRWEITDLGDSPAAGIPLIVAIIETFWIWCASLIVLFLLHSPVANFSDAIRVRKEADSDVFE